MHCVFRTITCFCGGYRKWKGQRKRSGFSYTSSTTKQRNIYTQTLFSNASIVIIFVTIEAGLFEAAVQQVHLIDFCRRKFGESAEQTHCACEQVWLCATSSSQTNRLTLISSTATSPPLYRECRRTIMKVEKPSRGINAPIQNGCPSIHALCTMYMYRHVKSQNQ